MHKECWHFDLIDPQCKHYQMCSCYCVLMAVWIKPQARECCLNIGHKRMPGLHWRMYWLTNDAESKLQWSGWLPMNPHKNERIFTKASFQYVTKCYTQADKIAQVRQQWWHRLIIEACISGKNNWKCRQNLIWVNSNGTHIPPTTHTPHTPHTHTLHLRRWVQSSSDC